MGAKEAKQEQAMPEARPEEKTEEKAQHQKEESNSTPFVLLVDLHCVGCAKKIEKSILKIRGVEGVVIDLSQNQVTIKGVIEPQAICTKIMEKTKRRAQVLSPIPTAEGEPIPEVVNSQVSGLTTVELNVNLHCEACAEQLKRKILKMRGVRSATTELSSGKVRVTGTIDANKLVDYVYRRTKKQANIVPQPESQPEKPPVAEAEAEAKPEEEKKEAEKPPEEPKPEEKKLEEVAQGENKPPPEEEKKEGSDQGNNGEGNNGTEENKEEPKKEEEPNILTDEQTMQRMMYYYQPLYVIERIPPPQLFSDENPNACCIT